MTLVQVLVDETSLHIACDFCVTNPHTLKVVRSDAFKLVTVTSPWMTALIGVTGVGELQGKPIGTWIADATSAVDDRRSVEDVVDALARKAAEPLSRIGRLHTFVVGAVIGTQTRVSLVSNFEVIRSGRIETSPTAASTLTVSSIKPKTAQLFATGAPGFILLTDREELERMLRSGSPEAAIQTRLAEVNAAVSRQTRAVSEGCYVASLYATGRGSSRPFLTEEQKGDMIPPDVEQVFRRLGVRLKPAIGPDGKPSPIQVVGSGLLVTSRSSKYFREQLKLQPDSAELWNAYGVFLEDRRQFEEAIGAYERAAELDPANAWAISNLARQHWLHRGDTAEADCLYTEAVRVADPAALPRVLSDFAAFCDEGLADARRARELHERALAAGAEPFVKARLALFLMKHRQEPERADALFADALTEQPDDPQILAWAAEADWFYKQDREAARTKLEKACTSNPRNARIWRFAGDVCAVLGDGSSAAYYYRKAMKRGVSGPEIQSAYGALQLWAGSRGVLAGTRRSGRVLCNRTRWR